MSTSYLEVVIGVVERGVEGYARGGIHVNEATELEWWLLQEVEGLMELECKRFIWVTAQKIKGMTPRDWGSSDGFGN